MYRGVVELCVVKYRDAEGLYVGTREAAFCALRAQLLMALHDAGATELCSQARQRSLISDIADASEAAISSRLQDLGALLHACRRTTGGHADRVVLSMPTAAAPELKRKSS